MKNALAIFCFLVSILLLTSISGDLVHFQTVKNEPTFKIPNGFPKPVYDFKNNKPTEAGFQLGRKLFHDPILSLDSSTSCSSCHQQFSAFGHVDHSLSHGIESRIGKRNVPTIQNVIWQPHFMWDGGVNHLDLFPIAPITNPVEMGESLEHVLLKLKRSKEYSARFKAAFHHESITSERMLKAISQFIGQMISADSRYDGYVAGKDSLTQQELAGLTLFQNRCVSCHPPPLFTDYSFRNIGLRMDTALKDSGRVGLTGLKSDFMKFKVPTLRNIEITPPYMHDGRFRTLQQTLEHYGKGVFFTNSVDPEVKRLAGLTRNERADLIAFLRTLTDQNFLKDRRFRDPAWK